MLTPLIEIEATLDPPVSLGPAAAGERRMIAIIGGRFTGRIAGTVLPGGADWQLLRPDGYADIDARYHLQTEAGQLIEVRSRGLRHGPPEVMAALARGEPVAPDRYYFRTAMRFETAAPELAWLARTLAIAVGERRPDSVFLRVLGVG